MLIKIPAGKRFEHLGIKIEFIGLIILYHDRGSNQEFFTTSQELAAPGEISSTCTMDFDFKSIEKPYESYYGTNVKLRYVLRVTIAKRLSNMVTEKDLWVHSYRMPPSVNDSIKMEVGIEDCLHIEFEYNKSKYACIIEISFTGCDSR